MKESSNQKMQENKPVLELQKSVSEYVNQTFLILPPMSLCPNVYVNWVIFDHVRPCRAQKKNGKAANLLLDIWFV